MGIAVESKISWHNKRWHRGGIRNIVKQQKMASWYKHKYRGATKESIAVKSEIT
jgi:hypothetical protein